MRAPATSSRRSAQSISAIVLSLIATLASAAQARSEPKVADGPVIVKAGFLLYDINEVEESSETFEFEGSLILNWHDPREAFDPSVEGADERVYKGDYQFGEVYEGWRPQVVLTNESGRMDRQGVVLRILPDGNVWFVQEIDAVAESPLDLRYFPFDEQVLEAHFKLLGYSSDEVRLEPVKELSRMLPQLSDVIDNAGWEIRDYSVTAIETASAIASPEVVGNGSTLRVALWTDRKPGYLIRVVVLPLALFVVLSWAVFWMDRESLGDRMDISFIALLTVVAFQLMVEQALPAIPGFTLMAGFLTLNYLLIAATVVINLRVDFLDRAGRRRDGDLVDYRCRWIFPLIYFVLCPLLLLMLVEVL